MPNIIDFSQCEYSIRHGSYGGTNGDKDGILYNNQFYIIKYPKPSRYFKGISDISYVTSPLSEYIGSHIYDILGYDVHETILGYRNDKLVVACKDFCEHSGIRLMEMRTIKNGANKELESLLEQQIPHSTTGDIVNLNEQLLHLQHNPTLQKVNGVSKRFWDMIIIDILIDNNDRNNGNWGILVDETTNSYRLAPIYDNGNAFSNKATDEQLRQYLQESSLTDRLIGERTAYEYNGKQLSAKKMLRQNIPELQSAMERNIPNIQEHLSDIKAFISNIPEQYHGKTVCSDIRKQYYITGIETRLQQLLLPAYEKMKQQPTTRENRLKALDDKFGHIKTQAEYPNPHTEEYP